MSVKDTSSSRLSDSASFVLILLVSGVIFLWWSQKSAPSSASATEDSALVCPFGEVGAASTSSDEAQRLIESVSPNDMRSALND